MNEPANRALLPAGLRDLLPTDAAHEAAGVERLMACFASQGFERVKPPLVEFEDNLLSGSGAALAPHTFRIMDPISQRMLALRPDMTLQVARIADTRLKNAPRPLRLSYAGQVLRVKGTQLRPERQFGQAGIELIGSAAPAADSEVIVLVVEALRDLGVQDISVDLTLPPLVPALTQDMGIGADVPSALRDALDHKDTALVRALGGKAADLLEALINAAGPAGSAAKILDALPLPARAAAERAKLAAVIQELHRAAPDLILTIDPVENRGFQFYSGVTFTIFARAGAAELGRGGRYLAGNENEPAVGASLFMDAVLAAARPPEPQRSIFLPFGTAPALGRRLRAEGWTTRAGLETIANASAEARRLGCTHILLKDKPEAL